MPIETLENPELNSFLKWVQAGAPDPTKSDLAFSLATQPMPSLNLNTPTETLAETTPQFAPEAIADSSLALPNMAKEAWNAWQQSRGFPSPTSKEVSGLEEGLTPNELVPSHAITPTPSPITPPTPKPVGVPGTGPVPAPEQTISQSLQGQPAAGFIRDRKEGEELGGPYIPPQAQPVIPPQIGNIEEQAGLKPAGYFEGLMKEREAAFPKSTAAALQSVGRQQGEFQLAQKPIFTQMVEGGLAALAGVNREAIRDKEQERLTQMENKQLEWALRNASHKDQVLAARMTLEREEDRLKRDKLGEMANFELANLPPDFGNKPGDPEKMAGIMSKLGAAWRLPPDYVQKYLDGKWNPAKGQYDNLYMSPTQKWELELKAKAEIIKRNFPGMPDRAAFIMSWKGEWQDWANDTLKVYDMQIAEARQNGNHARADELTKEKGRLVNETNLYAVANLAEMLKKIPGLSKEMARNILIATMPGGKEAVEAQAKIDVANINAAGERAKTSITTNTPKTETERLQLHSQLLLYPMNFMPEGTAAFLGLAKDKFDAQSMQTAINDAKVRVMSGKGSPQDMQVVQQYMQAEWQAFTINMPQTANVLQAMGQMPSNPEEMDAFYKRSVVNRVYQSIDDATYAKQIMGIAKNVPTPSTRDRR